MDGFSYLDIFQTKGVEYLLIIAFLILIIPFWIVINNKKVIVEKIKNLGTLTLERLKIPKGIFYHQNHTWTFLEKSGLAEVGIDDLLLHLVGKVKFNFLNNEGDQVKKGELLTEIVSNGKLLRVYSPISGKILEINRKLSDNSELIEKSPYREGWLFKMEPANWFAETNNCIDGEKASGWFKNEIASIKDFLAETLAKNSPASSLVFQEGGELRDNVLAEMPAEVWNDFQQQFLNQN